MTEWRAIPAFPSYQVSDAGEVRRSDRLYVNGRDLVQGDNGRGYRTVTLYRARKGFRRYVHRLVLAAFVGPVPPGYEAAHRDGNRANNAVDNLRWASRSSNHLDRHVHGTMPTGERHKWAKLRSSDLGAVREAVQGGLPQRTVAARFGISQSHVSRIVHRRTWAHEA